MSRAVRPLLPFAEAALVVLSLAVVLSFNRLFDDGNFFWRLSAFALVAHGVSIITRRAGWSVAAGGAVSLVALALTVGIVLYPSTTVLGIPTGDTISIVRADLASVWNDFQSVTAPTPVTTPFLLAAGLALWWSAFVADWAAFRVWVPFESVVPAGTVFVFASLFAASESRVPLTAIFVLAAMAFLLIHRVTRQQSNSGWVSTDVQRGTNALLRAGAALTVAAVVLAVIVGPNLPQAESAGLVSWRGTDSSGGPRTTVSPLVDIQQKLVEQSNVELFTVTSDQRAYWRLTALDEFDGQIWKSDGSYGSADGGLPKSVDSAASKNLVSQHYRIGNLNSIWLPAAYEPRSVDNASGDVRYEPATATLIVGNNAPTSNSAAYDIQSEFPVFDPAQLQAASEPVPNEVEQKDLQLPTNFTSTGAADLARQIVADAGASSVYDQAIALQTYFRDNFTYDLNVPRGHDESAIDRFLAVRRGYCEQFAGTYAAMARSLGLPARVAVGFTPGQQDDQDPNEYHVLGLNAHAWPEVYIGGQGWVLFEPTPTRGAPFAEQYTGVVEEQAVTANSTATFPTTVPQATPTTASPNSPTTQPREDVAADGGSTSSEEPAFWSTTRFGGKALITTGVLVVLGVLYVIGIAVFWAAFRHRRRARAVDPDERVRLAWQESIEAQSLIGLNPSRSETPAEFGARAASTAGLDGFADLARLLIRSSYGPSGATDDDAQRAFALSEQVAGAARAQTPLWTRVRSNLDPRPFDKRRPVKRTGPTRVHLDAPVIEILRFE